MIPYFDGGFTACPFSSPLSFFILSETWFELRGGSPFEGRYARSKRAAHVRGGGSHGGLLTPCSHGFEFVGSESCGRLPRLEDGLVDGLESFRP